MEKAPEHFQEKLVPVKTGMDTRFLSENAAKQGTGAPFQFNRNGKGSETRSERQAPAVRLWHIEDQLHFE
jgi:hypothetical protein